MHAFGRGSIAGAQVHDKQEKATQTVLEQAELLSGARVAAARASIRTGASPPPKRAERECHCDSDHS
jgi:hypothetical protein